METLKTMTAKLIKAADKLDNDPGYIRQAAEMANIAGKVLSAQRLYLEYKEMRDELPSSTFINSLGDDAED